MTILVYGLRIIFELDPKVFGARIRQARESISLSQEDLAATVNKDQAAISEYESGKRKLAAIDLPAFAKALKRSILYFYEGETSETDLNHALLTEFEKLPAGDAQQTAIQIIHALSHLVASLDDRPSTE